MPYAYEIKATRAEWDSLAWLASRYDSADALYRGAVEIHCEPETDVLTFGLTEPAAWEYSDALEADGGSIPCLYYQTTLGQSLLELEQRIV